MKIPFHLIIEFAQKFPEEIEAAIQNFIPNYDLMENQNEEIRGLFWEWLVYDYERPSKMSFLVEYILRNPDSLPEIEIKRLKQIVQTNWYSDFQLLGTKPGDGVTVEDVFTGKKYNILDTKASLAKENKGLLKARVALVEGKYYFVGSNPILIPVVYTERLKRILRKQKNQKESPRDTAIMLYEYQTKVVAPPPLSQKEIEEKKVRLKEKYLEKAAKYKAEMTFEELLKLIFEENEKDLFKFWDEVMKKGIPKLMFFEETELFQDIWNYFPHRVLNNKSPAELFFQLQEKKR